MDTYKFIIQVKCYPENYQSLTLYRGMDEDDFQVLACGDPMSKEWRAVLDKHIIAHFPAACNV